MHLFFFFFQPSFQEKKRRKQRWALGEGREVGRGQAGWGEGAFNEKLNDLGASSTSQVKRPSGGSIPREELLRVRLWR